MRSRPSRPSRWRISACGRHPRATGAVWALAVCAALDVSLQGCGVFSSATDCTQKASCVASEALDGASNLSPDGSGPAVGIDGSTAAGEAAVGDASSMDGPIGSADGAGRDGATPPPVDGAADVTSMPPADGSTSADAPADGPDGSGDGAAAEAGLPPGDGGGDVTIVPPSDGGPSACGLPSPLPNKGLIYDGGAAAASCASTLDATNYPGNFWFAYSDGTSDGGVFLHTADFGGCGGPTDCAFHASGSGFTGYGAGVGFTLNNNAIFDASTYSGLQVWFKGTASGTRGASYAMQNDSVHVKFLTGALDGSTADPRNGDDYGAYCPTTGTDAGGGGWIVCRLPFASLTRDGFRGVDSGAPNPATDMFDPQNLVKIEFEFSAFTLPDGGTGGPVGFDVWIDDVAFF